MTVVFRCFGCGGQVTNPLPDDSVLRAIAWCDWCIDEGKDQYLSPDEARICISFLEGSFTQDVLNPDKAQVLSRLRAYLWRA